VADQQRGTDLVAPVVGWFDANERPLPWRRTTPWGVLVSELMLQQTPVDRVLPRWREWLTRWPTPADLAAAPQADAIRAWDRLGYPRRARYLHLAAGRIVADHDGRVPDDEASLRALPGVGEYTAAAVLAFAFGRRSLVLDTNVRRVLARAIDGRERQPASISAVERSTAEAVWPRRDARAARWSAAVMELGALVCTARAPACDTCPIRTRCSWHAAGRPADAVAPRRQAAYEGSDRQARGAVMAALRDSDGPVPIEEIARRWPDDAQRDRAITGLLADGLAVRTTDGRLHLPH
jgi:A/G-specific adenine glycosylase